MVKLERNFPLRIKKEEALLRRLPQNHKKRAEITIQMRKNKADYKGERELDYHLSFLPEELFLIFNDLHLVGAKNHSFQIDTLLIALQAAFIIFPGRF